MSDVGDGDDQGADPNPELDRVRDLDRAAVLAAAEVVRRVTPADRGRPTPCPQWPVAGLLNHMSVQHRGFAAAARGKGGDLAVWREGEPPADPVADHLGAVGEVLEAFAGVRAGQQGFRLPEVDPDTDFPAGLAIGFHFIDYVVHGWDVARSIGVPLPLDGPVLEVAWQAAQLVPDEARNRPGAPFGAVVEVSATAPLLDRIVARLGRSPSWPD